MSDQLQPPTVNGVPIAHGPGLPLWQDATGKPRRASLGPSGGANRLAEAIAVVLRELERRHNYQSELYHSAQTAAHQSEANGEARGIREASVLIQRHLKDYL